MSETIIGATVIKTLRMKHAWDGEVTLDTNISRTIRPCLLDGVVPGYLITFEKTGQRRHLPASIVDFAEWCEACPPGIVSQAARELAAQEPEAIRIPEPVPAKPPREQSKKVEETPTPDEDDDDIPEEMAGFVDAAELSEKPKTGKRR